jgi:FkbM family methyltransferase
MNHITHALALRGFFEWRNVLIVNAICRKGDTVIDVGANIGTETLLFALRVGATGRVIALEPLPDNFTILRKMVAINQIENVSLFQAAASNCSGTVSFVPPAANWSIGEGYISTGGAVDSEISVQSVTLDRLYQQGDWHSLRVIVMDVEGSELAVLRGAEALIRKYRPYIILEWLPSLQRKQGHDPRVLYEFLHGHSYRMWRIGGFRLESTCAHDMEPGNYLCMPMDETFDGKTMAAHISRRMLRAAITPPMRWINPAVVPGRRQDNRGARG